jgi:hypothetical protein
MQDARTNRDEEIRQIAYRLWQEEGCPDGRNVEHWVRAESEWLEERRPKSKPKQPKSVKGLKRKLTRTAEREL